MKKTVYYWSPCLTNVGTVKSTLNSSIALAKFNSNYEVILLNVFGEWSDYEKYLNEKGVKVKNLTFKFKNILPRYGFFQSRFSYLLISLISFLPLLILLKRNKPDFIIAHLITSLPLLLFNLFKFNTKLILRISGYPKLNYIRKKFWHISSGKISNITCPTNELIKDLIEKDIFRKDKISLLSDAILNIEEFNKKINDKNFIANINLPENFFLAVGRFTKQKNYIYLVKEFQTICQKYPDQKLLIIGEGELKNEIEKLIIKLNLKSNIFIIGHTNNVYYYMKKAKAFILSSLWEEVGFVIVEAAMSNTSVVSSNCKNGPKEFLSNGEGGFIFNSDEKKALSASLETYIFSQKKDIFKKKIVAKKNCFKFTMYRHQNELKKILK